MALYPALAGAVLVLVALVMQARPAAADVDILGAFGKTHADQVGDVIDVSGDGKLKKILLKAGVGAVPGKGAQVSAHYTGRVLSNGDKFDSSVDRGSPFSFALGQGRVIKGYVWAQRARLADVHAPLTRSIPHVAGGILASHRCTSARRPSSSLTASSATARVAPAERFRAGRRCSLRSSSWASQAATRATCERPAETGGWISRSFDSKRGLARSPVTRARTCSRHAQWRPCQ